MKNNREPSPSTGLILKGGDMDDKSSAEIMVDMLIEEKNWDSLFGLNRLISKTEEL